MVTITDIMIDELTVSVDNVYDVVVDPDLASECSTFSVRLALVATSIAFTLQCGNTSICSRDEQRQHQSIDWRCG